MFIHKNKNSLNVMFFVVSFTIIAFVSQFTPTTSMEFATFLLLLFATIIVALFPLKYGNMSRINIYWLAISILYMYGISMMLLFYQLAIIIFLWNNRTKEVNLAYYPVYTVSFLAGPLCSYSILSLVGIEFNTASFTQMLLINSLFYVILLLFSGIVITFCRFKPSTQNNKEYALSELVATIFFILLGTVLYTFIKSYGEIAIIGALIFYLAAAWQSRISSTSIEKSDTLENIMDLQLQINDFQTRQQLTGAFLQKVKEVTEADRVAIIQETEHHFMLFDEKQSTSSLNHTQYKLLQDAFLANDILCIKKEASEQMGKWSAMESLVLLPMNEYERPTMLLLESKNRYAFNKDKIELVKLLLTAWEKAHEQKLAIEETRYMSEHCSLTDLHNYRYLSEQMELLESQLAHKKLDCISTIILDIDHFKRLNDTYGHENGNIILKKFAAYIRSLVDEKYVLARYGGEEFVILLPNIPSHEAVRIAEHLRKSIENLTYEIYMQEEEQREKVSVNATVSIGVANLPEHTENLSDLISFADKALYTGAKQAGRNRVALYTEQLSN